MGYAITLTPADWLLLLGHFLALSLLSVGGAIATAPDMHRFLVDEHHWLTDAQFTASIAIAQAAPGPNVLFVALLGWNTGLNAAGLPGAALGLLLAMAGILVPSSTLTYLAASWGHRNRELLAVRAFKQGMTPVVLALLIATGWLLAAPGGFRIERAPSLALSVVAMLLVWRTRIHLLWLLGAGALLGWFGLV